MDFSAFLHGFVKIDTYIYVSKLLQGLVKIYTWISPSCYMDLSKFIHRFVEVVTWICQSCAICISRSLPNKTKLKFDQDFEAC